MCRSTQFVLDEFSNWYHGRQAWETPLPTLFLIKHPSKMSEPYQKDITPEDQGGRSRCKIFVREMKNKRDCGFKI